MTLHGSQAWYSPKIETVCPLVYSLGFVWISCKSFPLVCVLGGIFPSTPTHETIRGVKEHPTETHIWVIHSQKPCWWDSPLSLALNR